MSDETCWRSECRAGCYYPTACSETATAPECGEVGTGAGEGATGQDTGTAWVTRSTDCPEAPAQAHLPAPGTAETDMEALASVIWHTSRADESTISATGANHVARAVLAAGYVPPTEVARREREAAEKALREAADDILGLVVPPGWPSVMREGHIDGLNRAEAAVLARADRLTAGEAS